MKVTDIQKQKNDSSKVSLFIDGEYAFSLDEVDALVMGIKTGMEVDREKLSEMVFSSKFNSAKNAALSLISRKSVCRKMVEDLLFEKSFDEEIVEAVCNELESLGYIDDYSYASLFLEYASEKLWGERKIRYELGLKGVSKTIIEDVLSDFSIADANTLSDVIAEKYQGLDFKDIKVKQKIQRFLIARGFDFSDINEAINICISNTEDEI